MKHGFTADGTFKVEDGVRAIRMVRRRTREAMAAARAFVNAG